MRAIGRHRLTRSASNQGGAPGNPVSFWLPLYDAGSGAVNLVPRKASGSGIATFTRATTAWTVLSNGLWASVASGTARSCYSPAGVYLGYFAEAAATNLCLQSSTLNVTWSAGAVTIGGSVTLPDGTTGTVNKIQETNATAVHFLQQTQSKAASALPYVFSVFVKAGERTFTEIGFDDNAGNGATILVNLSTGAVAVAAAAFGAGFTSVSGSVTSYPAAGFFKISLTATTNTATSIRPVIVINTDGSTHYQSYAGSTGSGIYAWNAQLEQSTVGTSPIPTTTVAVTRNADVLSYPAAGNLIGTSGTVCVEITGPAAASTIAYTLNTSTGLPLFVNNTNQIRFFDGTNNNTGIAYTPSAISIQKAATKWSGATGNTYVAGVAGTPTAFDGDMSFGTTLYLGTNGGVNNFQNGTIKNVKIWTTALTDGQIAAL